MQALAQLVDSSQYDRFRGRQMVGGTSAAEGWWVVTVAMVGHQRVCWLRALRALISGAGLDQKLDWMGAWEAGHRSRQSQMAEGWREGEEEGKARSCGCSDAGLNSSARLQWQSNCPAVMLGYGRHTALDYQHLVCFVHTARYAHDGLTPSPHDGQLTLEHSTLWPRMNATASGPY